MRIFTINMSLIKESSTSRIIIMYRDTHSTKYVFRRLFTYIKFPDHRIEVHLGNFEMRSDPADLDFALKTTSLKSPKNLHSQRKRKRPTVYFKAVCHPESFMSFLFSLSELHSVFLGAETYTDPAAARIFFFFPARNVRLFSSQSQRCV